MAPTLYMTPFSPPVRAVLMTARAVGLTLNLKELNLYAGEHLSPDYLKINPQHTVPTLVEEDGFTVWESQAIMRYIVAKYGKDDSLYPKDLRKRAIVDQRIDFNGAMVLLTLTPIIRAILQGYKNSLDEDDKKSVHRMYKRLDNLLKNQKWIAGESVTIADYSLISPISSVNLIFPIEAQQFPRMAAYLKNAENLPEYEANKKGLSMLKEILHSQLLPKARL